MKRIALFIVMSACVSWIVAAVPDSRVLERMIRQNRRLVLIDVRSPQEYREGHIPTALNIPLRDILEKPGIVPPGSPLVLYCLTGLRSGQAARILKRHGRKKAVNFGGIDRWKGRRVTGEAPGRL